MLIYYLYVIYILIVSALFLHKRDIASRKLETFLIWLALFFILGFRDISVGNDLERYVEYYNSISKIDPFETRTEIGFVFLLKFLNFLGLNERGFVLATSLIISSIFSWFYRCYSKDYGLSFVLFILVGVFAFSLSGMRQSIAICITLIAFSYALNKKLIPFLVITFLATTFHSSAYIFFLVYIICRVKLDSYRKLFVFGIILVIVAILNTYLLQLFKGFSTEKYNTIYFEGKDSNSMNILPIIFQFYQVLSIIVLWSIQRKKLSMVTHLDSVLFNLSLLTLLFTLLAINLSTVSRFSFYFIPYLNVILPNTIKEFKNKQNQRYVVIAILLISLSYFYFANNNGVLMIDDYKFDFSIFFY